MEKTPIDKNNSETGKMRPDVTPIVASKLLKFLFGLVFLFPYVGIFQGIDIQPNFLILTVFVICVFVCFWPVKLQTLPVIVVMMTVLLCFVRYIIQVSSLDSVGVSPGSMVSLFTSCFHLIVILLCYLVVHNGLLPRKSHYLVIAVLIYVVVGLIQLYDSSFLSSLVYRGYQDLTSSGRGVRSLTSEPAVFGHLLTVMTIMVVFYAVRNNWSINRIVIFLLFLFAANVFLSRSFYSISYHLFMLSLFLFFINKKAFFGLVILMGIVFPAFFLNFLESEIRFFHIARTLIENPLDIYEQGAMLRVLNVPISIIGSHAFGILGSGFAPLTTAQGSVPFLPANPYFFEVGDRNMGGGVELFLRLGILSIPFFVWYFYTLYKISRIKFFLRGREVSIGLWFAITLFLVTFTYSSIGNPMIWISFFLVHNGFNKKTFLKHCNL